MVNITMATEKLTLTLSLVLWKLKQLMNGSKRMNREHLLLKEAHMQEWVNLDLDG